MSQQDSEAYPIHGPVKAEINCIAPRTSAAPQVRYSGGAAPQIFNEAYAMVSTDISDARKSPTSFTLDTHGFTCLRRPTPFQGFDDEDAVADGYYSEVTDIIKEATGAKDVFVFDHTVRRGDPNSTRKPANHVHNDYTQTTGVTRARDMLGEDVFAAHQHRRMIQINVWRSLNPEVRRAPLTLCDASSVEPSDLIPAEIHFPETDRIGEILALRWSPDQRWYYFSAMTRDEVLLIKGYDTLESPARFTPHTAFEYPQHMQDPAAPPRESIEARAFAFY